MGTLNPKEAIRMENDKKEHAQEILTQMHEAIGQLRQQYEELEQLGHGDHYIKQIINEEYMGSLPDKLNELSEQIEGDEDENN